MGNELVPAGDSGSLRLAVEAAAAFVEASQASNTKRGYASDWRQFSAWCAEHGLADLPALPATVATYLGALATNGAKLATIRRRAAAIGDRHRRAGHDNPAAHPLIKATLAGIARTIGAAPKKKAALTVELLVKVLRRIPNDLAGIRDRALLLLLFAGALRRSELVGLDADDVTRHPQGLVIALRRSKTDQAGAGTLKAIPRGRKLHVTDALDAWLAAAKIADGPIFRGVRGTRVLSERLSDGQVARIVKKRVGAAGLDPTLFSGHSGRSGFITSADEHGAKLERNAAHAGHVKLDTTRGYVQVTDAFRDHAGKGYQ
jgi:site-specific recombinase XerD